MPDSEPLDSGLPDSGPSDSDLPEAGALPTGDRVGERTHPLSGLVQGALWGGAGAAFIVFSELNDGGIDALPWWLFVLAVLLGGILVGQLLGFVTWWFTRYVIDDHELRIDSGFLTKKSRRAAFERIQSVDVTEPLLARLVGLAELRVDLAGGDETRLRLRFLKLDHARRLRRLLLTRAAGEQEAEMDGGDASDGAPLVTVDGEEGELVVRVLPPRTLLGAALTLDAVGAVGALLVLLLAAIGFGQPLVLLGGAFPVVAWAVRVIGQRVIAEWDFTLHRTPRGLQIRRGLLDRTTQTIPYARVQGVAVEEPIVWRRLGWHRLEVDVAGSAAAAGEATTATLLPIADGALTSALVEELVPSGEAAEGVASGPGDVHRASSRSWIFAPVGWRHRWISLGADRATSSTGWMKRRTSHAPHAKAQSVALRQGPLQRRLGLATVEVHTPDGPVDVDAHHLEAFEARDVALAALAAAREARTR